MIDFYLKFENRDIMLEVLKDTPLLKTNEDQTTEFVVGSMDHAAVEVGNINGIDGWHINVRIVNETFDLSILESYRVYPQNPVCVWA